MKLARRPGRMLVSAVVAVTLTAFADAVARDVAILPLGDSITDGGGYLHFRRHDARTIVRRGEEPPTRSDTPV